MDEETESVTKVFEEVQRGQEDRQEAVSWVLYEGEGEPVQEQEGAHGGHPQAQEWGEDAEATRRVIGGQEAQTLVAQAEEIGQEGEVIQNLKT